MKLRELGGTRFHRVDDRISVLVPNVLHLGLRAASCFERLHLHVSDSFSLEVTPLGVIDHVSGLPPAMQACLRKPFANFRTEPAEYIGPVQVEFAVSETEPGSYFFPWRQSERIALLRARFS